MSFLDKRIIVRIRAEEYDAIRNAMQRQCDVYFNVSHFIRVAVMREIKRCRDENSSKSGKAGRY